MMKQLKKIKFPDRLSFLLAAVGIILSFWAVLKASEANTIALNANKASATANAISSMSNDLSRQANDLVKESNKITKQEAGAHPRIEKGPSFEDGMVLTCAVKGSEKPFGIIIATTPVFDVANNGAQPIWLFETGWKNDEVKEWSITLHHQYDDIYHPFEFSPETEYRFLIVALHYASFETKEEAVGYLNDFPSLSKVEVEFQFENEKKLTWPFTLSVLPKDEDQSFSTDCIQHTIFFATQY